MKHTVQFRTPRHDFRPRYHRRELFRVLGDDLARHYKSEVAHFPNHIEIELYVLTTSEANELLSLLHAFKGVIAESAMTRALAILDGAGREKR